MVVPGAQPPKNTTVPPRPTEATACSQTSGRPVASITTSGPRPLVMSRSWPTRSWVSELSTHSATPSSRTRVAAALPTEGRAPPAGRMAAAPSARPPEAGRARSLARHRAGKLVADAGGNVRNHHGVAAAQHLDVRPAREGGLDPDGDPPGLRLGNREVFEAEISRSMEDLRPHGVMYTLTASWPRISSTPRASSPRGSRWVMSPSTRIRPVASASKASRSSVGDDEYVEEMVSSRW